MIDEAKRKLHSKCYCEKNKNKIAAVQKEYYNARKDKIRVKRSASDKENLRIDSLFKLTYPMRRRFR